MLSGLLSGVFPVLVIGELFVVSGVVGARSMLVGKLGAPIAEPEALATRDEAIPAPPVVPVATKPGALLPPLVIAPEKVDALPEEKALPPRVALPPSLDEEGGRALSNAAADDEPPECGLAASEGSRANGSVKKSSAAEKVVQFSDVERGASVP